VYAEKTKYTLISHDQNAKQNHNIKTGDRSSENVSELKYLGTNVSNQKLILDRGWSGVD
jgi:hypothetical protein